MNDSDEKVFSTSQWSGDCTKPLSVEATCSLPLEKNTISAHFPGMGRRDEEAGIIASQGLS